MRGRCSILLLLAAAVTALPSAVRAQRSPRPLIGLGATAAIFGSNDRDAGGLGLGGAMAVLGRRAALPGMLRGELVHLRFAEFGGDCALRPGSGNCGGAGPIALTGALASIITPLGDRTRPFASAMAGGIVNRSGNSTSIDGALGFGIGLGTLARRMQSTLELRALWLLGADGSSFVAPLSLTIYR